MVGVGAGATLGIVGRLVVVGLGTVMGNMVGYYSPLNVEGAKSTPSQSAGFGKWRAVAGGRDWSCRRRRLWIVVGQNSLGHYHQRLNVVGLGVLDPWLG